MRLYPHALRFIHPALASLRQRPEQPTLLDSSAAATKMNHFHRSVPRLACLDRFFFFLFAFSAFGAGLPFSRGLSSLMKRRCSSVLFQSPSAPLAKEIQVDNP